MTQPPRSPSSTEELVRAWYQAAPGYPWGSFEEWHLPAVDALADRLLVDGDALSSARSLGEQRAGQGVSIGEALNDLQAPFQLTRGTQPPHDVSVAFAEGWAEAEIATLLGRSSIDPLTGFATLDYLYARLGEVYARPRDVSEQCLLFVDPGERSAAPGPALIRTLQVSRRLHSVFSSGEPVAVLPQRLFVAVVECAAADDYLHAIESVEPDPAAEPASRLRVWSEPLPPHRALAERRLLELDAA